MGRYSALGRVDGDSSGQDTRVPLQAEKKSRKGTFGKFVKSPWGLLVVTFVLTLAAVGLATHHQTTRKSLNTETGTVKGHTETAHQVTFSKAFTKPPKVLTSLQFLDMSVPNDFRYHAHVSNVTTKGFTLTCSTWNDNKIHAFEFSYLAIGE